MKAISHESLSKKVVRGGMQIATNRTNGAQISEH